MSAAHLLEKFYGLPPNAPLLPFEVPPLVALVQVEAAKARRGPGRGGAGRDSAEIPYRREGLIPAATEKARHNEGTNPDARSLA
jgi:hypothetical protein